MLFSLCSRVRGSTVGYKFETSLCKVEYPFLSCCDICSDMETVASDMREALEGCPLSKYILQPDGEKVEIKDLEVALSAGLVHIDVSNCYQCPGLGEQAGHAHFSGV